MPVQIASRRASQAALLARFPGAALIDVTSRGDAPWVRFSQGRACLLSGAL